MAEVAKLPVHDVRISTKGPHFFRGEDGAVLLEIHLDSRSKFGLWAVMDVDRRLYWTAVARARGRRGLPEISRDGGIGSGYVASPS